MLARWIAAFALRQHRPHIGIGDPGEIFLLAAIFGKEGCKIGRLVKMAECGAERIACECRKRSGIGK